MKTIVIFLLALFLAGCAGDKSGSYQHDNHGDGYTDSYLKKVSDPMGKM
jgi:PBP1b-binding outer membrane lipoprotein LpoB